MDHEGKAILGSLAGILSYMVLLVVSIGDVMRNYEAMVHISPLHVSFLITLALVIFWFLPISIFVHRNAQMANMKKTAFISKRLIFFFVLFALMGTVSVVAELFDKPSNTEADYYASINQAIKDQDFYTARVSKGQITLYDKNNLIVETMSFDFYGRSMPLVTIRKEFGNLYFVTAGSVDDEYGVVFMNDSANNLDGITSLERLGGNAFLYSTRS